MYTVFWISKSRINILCLIYKKKKINIHWVQKVFWPLYCLHILSSFKMDYIIIIFFAINLHTIIYNDQAIH